MSRPDSYSPTLQKVSLQPIEAYLPDPVLLEESRQRRDLKLKWLKNSDGIISETSEHSIVYDGESVGVLSLEKGFESGAQPWVYISDMEIETDKRCHGLGVAAVAAAYRHVMKPEWSGFVPSMYSDVDSELFIASLTNAELASARYDWQLIKEAQIRRRDPKRTNPKELFNLFEVGVILEPLRNMIKSGEI